MSTRDQTRLNIIRLEVDRVRIGMRRLSLLAHNNQNQSINTTNSFNIDGSNIIDNNNNNNVVFANTQPRFRETIQQSTMQQPSILQQALQQPMLHQDRRIIKRASCAICFEIFAHSTAAIAAFCGHVYCRRCFNLCRTINKKCGVCTRTLAPIQNQYRLHFNFDNEQNIVCGNSLCRLAIGAEAEIKALRCGCVFCAQCYNAMTGNCIKCRAELGGSNRMISLILSYH